jgi:hypothetical protein
VCGARSIVRNFWALRSGSSESSAQRVWRDAILEGLAVDATTLRTAAVLAGCDFAPKLRSVGLARALKAAQLHPGDIRACLGVLKKSEEAECAHTVRAFERAMGLLTAEPSAPLPAEDVATLRPVDREALAQLVESLEEAGEPWALRAVLSRRSPPALRELLPSAWTHSAHC